MALCKDNGSCLPRAIWWFVSLHFGFRARDEARKLCWGDIGLEKDNSGEHLVLYCERGTKTRKGEEFEVKRAFNPIVYATNSENCPISYYKEFKNHRPVESLSQQSPFFLACKHKVDLKQPVWYANTPLGKNKLGEILGQASKLFGFSGREVANHSVRKTSIGKLLDAQVPDIFVAQHSGHKNTDSLKNYKSASKVQRQTCLQF